MSLIYPNLPPAVNDIISTASNHSWEFFFHDKKGRMVSFRKDKKRINLYFTRMTVGICIPGEKQRYEKNVSIEALEKLFILHK